MELSREHYNDQNTGQAQLAVFDFVGELLAITLEKHEVEVEVDASNISQNKSGTFDCIELVRTMVDCENVVETENSLEITLSGAIQKDRGMLESFMLFFTMTWDSNMYTLKKRAQEKGVGTNHLWLQFGHKPEQFTDLLYRVNLYRKELSGRQFELANGYGFLVFGKDSSGYIN